MFTSQTAKRRKPVKRTIRSITTIAALLVAALSYLAYEGLGTDSPIGSASSASSSPATSGSEPLSTSAPTSEKMVSDAKKVVKSIDTLDTRPDPGGYERGCGEGKKCVLGPAWTDDHDAPLGHNGCDTRNDVLAQQLDNIKYKEGSDCIVVYGTYVEPYTGEKEEFIKGEPSAEQDEIDHVLAGKLGWDLGLHKQSLDRRIEFANDAEYNLLVSTHATNASGYDSNGDGEYDPNLGEYPPKSDLAAHEWLPYLTDTGRACDFSARYVLTADRYDLPILTADKTAIEEAFSRC